MGDLLTSIAQRVYGKSGIVREYARFSQLLPTEVAILNELRPEIEGMRPLDIGVGGGRTTGPILEISRDYTAIDIAPKMVAATRKRFGLESIWCCDARDMSRFGDSRFDFALFAFNGIDYINYEERERVLNEVARVLRAGGILVFSSHNRNLRDLGKPPWQGPQVRFTAGLIKETMRALLCLPRHARLKRYEVYEAITQ
jgi:ubiquinone/menaquinone biosynthesis C-methylase UbiE